MRRAAALCLIAAGAICALPPSSPAQQDALAARCDQLFRMADRALSRRSEGGGGPNLRVQGAGVDCARGRYERGIDTLERILRDQGFTIPPPPG